MSKRLPKLNTRISVTWNDPCGLVNQPLSEATPASCWTEGRLVKVTPDFSVLASSQYADGTGEAVIGDYTALPIGIIASWRKI